MMRFGRGVFSYRPGEPLSDFWVYFDHAPAAGYDQKFEIVSAAYRFRKSVCFQKSNGKFGCTACHDPHQALPREKTVEKTQQVCAGCNGAHSQGCVACHMPRRQAQDVIHVSITDHWITARPASAERLRSESVPLPYAGEVVPYYPKSLSATTENSLLLAIAQVKGLAHLRKGLTQLEELLARLRPQAARPYFEMAEAFLNTGQAARTTPFYLEAAKRGPQSWRYWYGVVSEKPIILKTRVLEGPVEVTLGPTLRRNSLAA
jgi:predicted CXXCH cytochrome family protein